MAKKVKKSQEQIDLEAREQDERIKENTLTMLRKETHIGEPTVEWKIGERVTRGHITEAHVIDVLDGGKIIKLHQIHIKGPESKNAGERTESDEYVPWYSISKYWTEADYSEMPIFSEDQDLRISYSQRSISGLLLHNYHFGFNMEPDYQRGNVWKLDDKVKLIDSIFHNVDIGKFVFIRNSFKNIMKPDEVLDGKQRITTLIEFYERRFSYNGLNYDQLHKRDQYQFDEFPIAWGEANHNGHGDVTAEQKYRYFLRLNTGGKVQDPEHIKKVEALWKEAKTKGN